MFAAMLFAVLGLAIAGGGSNAHSLRQQEHSPVDSCSPECLPSDSPSYSATMDTRDLRERVQAYSGILTRNSGFSEDESLVRWNTPICFFLAGWRAEEIDEISKRLSEISASAGAPLAKQGCSPNFVVLATPKPREILEAWFAKNPRLFGNASPLQVRHFLESQSPGGVLIWRNVDIGRVATMRFGHFVPSNAHAELSAFTGITPLKFISIFAVVDTSHTEVTSIHQLADYVAMMGLTNIEINANVGSAPSILRLFRTGPGSAPASLSDWDAAFLSALYHADQTSRSQAFDITQGVLDALIRRSQ